MWPAGAVRQTSQIEGKLIPRAGGGRLEHASCEFDGIFSYDILYFRCVLSWIRCSASLVWLRWRCSSSPARLPLNASSTGAVRPSGPMCWSKYEYWHRSTHSLAESCADTSCRSLPCPLIARISFPASSAAMRAPGEGAAGVTVGVSLDASSPRRRRGTPKGIARSSRVALMASAHMNELTLTLPKEVELDYLADAWQSDGEVAAMCGALYGLFSLALGVSSLPDGADGGVIGIVVALRILPGVVAAAWAAALVMGGLAAGKGPLVVLWSPVTALLAVFSCAGVAGQAHYCVASGATGCFGLDVNHVPWLAVAWTMVVPHVLVQGMHVRWVHATAVAILGAAIVLILVAPGNTESVPRAAELITSMIGNAFVVAVMGFRTERLARLFTVSQLNDSGSVHDPQANMRGAGVRGRSLLASVQSSPQAMLLKAELDHTLVFASEACMALYGYSHHDLEGHPLDETVVPGDRAALRDALKNGLANTRAPVTVKYRRQTKDGRVVPVVLHGFYMTRFDAPACFVAWEWPDQSDLAPASPSNAHSSTSPSNAERRRENKVIMQIATHELFNSMHILDASCAAIADAPELEAYRDETEDIVGSGKMIHLLVSNLLALVKLSDGSVVTHPEPTDPRQLVQQVVNTQRPLAKVKVVTSIDSTVPEVVTIDGENTQLVISNFLNAAVRSAEQGEVRVSLGLEGDKKLRFDITEQGSLGGATMKMLQAALAEGRRIAEDRQRRTALTLPVCTQLAETLLGRISIEESGGFLTASLVAPFSPAEISDSGAAGGGGGGGGAAGTPARGATGPAAPPASSVAGAHVLLVDDSRSIRKQGARMLDRLGCTYELLEDGDQVVGAWERTARPYDCILLDIFMHRTDGAEVCKRLRDSVGARLPIVAMTSHTEPGDVDRFMKMGFDLILSKPFSEDSLRAAMIKGRQARGTGKFSRMSARTADEGKVGRRLSDPRRHGFTTPQEAIDEADGDVPDAFDDDEAGMTSHARQLPGAVRK